MTKKINEGLVSCIIPTYKRSDMLINAITSITTQTYENLEIIIVDDNEPNDEFSVIVQERIMQIEDERIKYLQQENPINGAAARNYGIKHARGEYIAFLDDDDEWLPEKIEKQVKVLQDLDSSYGGVTCLVTIFKNGKEVRTSPAYTEDNLHKRVLEHSVSIFTDTVLFRKGHLDKTGYFNESLQRHQDLQLFTDFLAHYKMKPMNEVLVHVHTDDPSNRPDTKKLIGVKENFFKAMTDNMNLYSKKEQKNILASHYFEIILVALREKKFKYVIEYLFKIGLNISAYKNVFRRYKERR